MVSLVLSTLFWASMKLIFKNKWYVSYLLFLIWYYLLFQHFYNIFSHIFFSLHQQAYKELASIFPQYSAFLRLPPRSLLLVPSGQWSKLLSLSILFNISPLKIESNLSKSDTYELLFLMSHNHDLTSPCEKFPGSHC